MGPENPITPSNITAAPGKNKSANQRCGIASATTVTIVIIADI